MRPFSFSSLCCASLLVAGSVLRSSGATTFGPGYSPGTVEVRGPNGENLVLSTSFAVDDGLPSISWDGLSWSDPEGANASAGLAVSWSIDPKGSAAWVASQPDGTGMQIANISLGGSVTDPAVLNVTLQSAVDRWQANLGDGNFEWETFQGDRGRGRENSDQEAALSWINSSPTIDPSFGLGSPVSVPEPSTLVLCALGALSLICRRRELHRMEL